MINFKCSACGHEMEAPQSLAGEPLLCPQCGLHTKTPRSWRLKLKKLSWRILLVSALSLALGVFLGWLSQMTKLNKLQAKCDYFINLYWDEVALHTTLMEENARLKEPLGIVKAPSPDARSAVLGFDIINTKNCLPGLFEIKTKITNRSSSHIKSATATCLLHDAQGQIFDFCKETVVYSHEGGLIPGRSIFYSWLFYDTDLGTVANITFQVDAIE